MANWFYYYDNDTAERKVPFNFQQIKDLAAKGKIKSNTIIETDEGKRGKAGQLSGISFPIQTDASSSAPSPNNPYISKPPSGSGLHFDPARPAAAAVLPKIAVRKTTAVKDDSSFSFFGWLFDIGFKQSYVMKFIRLLASIFYVISAVLILLGGLARIGWTVHITYISIRLGQNAAIEIFSAVFGIILALLAVVTSIILCRLGFEFWLYLVDWLVATKKASEKYNGEEENR